MDPTTTWQQLLACLENDQHIDALFLTEELQEWAGKGGFLPECINLQLLDFLQSWLAYSLSDNTDLDNEAYGS